jgi:hypothetical protein
LRGEGEQQVARWIALGCLFLLCAGALWRAPLAVSRLGTLAGESSRLDYADREIAGGNGIIVDQAAAYEARAIIPPRENYRVVVGPRVEGATDLSVPFAPLYFRYFLMPRHQVEQARWIVCFGCDLGATSPGAQVIWTDGHGISVARAAS